MPLDTAPVYRNLQTRVTLLYLELEDLFVVMILAVVFNIVGRFMDRELAGIPMSLLLQYGVPMLSIPLLILFKYGQSLKTAGRTEGLNSRSLTQAHGTRLPTSALKRKATTSSR
ncbi:MAG: hypothetical protein L0387_22050 [Acidobacteria bacterium]|nr:hypothetical protein [Acidobacteriota bacterium]